MPYVSVSACLTSQACPATRVPDSRVEACLENQFRPALRVPDSRVDACLTSQGQSSHTGARLAVRRASFGLTPDDTMDAHHLGGLPMIQWKLVWRANLSQPGGRLSFWSAPVWLGWLGVPTIEGPGLGAKVTYGIGMKKCPENREATAGGYSLVYHFAGPGSAGLGINCLDRNSDIGEARLRWAGF